MGEQVDIHRKILSANSTGELMSVYDNWSEDYDEVLTEQWGYTSPQMAADLLAASIACDSISVLDAFSSLRDQPAPLPCSGHRVGVAGGHAWVLGWDGGSALQHRLGHGSAWSAAEDAGVA